MANKRAVSIEVSAEDARELLDWSERIAALYKLAIEAAQKPGGPKLAANVLPSRALHARHIAALRTALRAAGKEEG